MEDFQLLESLLDTSITFETTDTQDAVPDDTPADDCPHTDRIIDKGMYVCLCCGFSEKVADGQTYTSHKMYKRASRNTSIAASLEQKGFDSRVIITANQIYNIVIDNSAKRTGNRSSISCACVFQAFKVLNHPIDYAHIYTKFGIKKKSALKGLKIVNAEIAKRKNLDFHKIVSSPIIPENFICSYMEELKAPEASIKEVLRIYARAQEHRELRMSRPQSIAAGCIFYWLKGRGMTEAIIILEQRANLSQLTISKKAKLVAQKIDEITATELREQNV